MSENAAWHKNTEQRRVRRYSLRQKLTDGMRFLFSQISPP